MTQTVKNLPAMQETWISIPESERSPAEENGNLLQYSCLENSTDRGVWWATVHRVAKTEATCTHAQQLKSDLVYSL